MSTAGRSDRFHTSDGHHRKEPPEGEGRVTWERDMRVHLERDATNDWVFNHLVPQFEQEAANVIPLPPPRPKRPRKVRIGDVVYDLHRKANE